MSKIDLKKDSEKRLKNKVGRKQKRDTKLQELEKQLEFAESRCGTLKQQLDYIKLLYGDKKYEELEKQPSMEEGHGDGCNVNQYNYSVVSRWDSQEGNFGGREDGDCPEFIKQTESQTNSMSTNSSNKQIALILNQEKRTGEVKKKGYGKNKGHFKLLKVKKKNSKRVKKRRKTEELSSSKVSNASSQTQTQTQSRHDAVVEIYKNAAANVESESGFEFVSKKNKIVKSSDGSVDIKKSKFGRNSETVESAAVKEKTADSKAKSCNSLNLKKKGSVLKEEGIQTEVSLDVNQFFQKRNETIESLPTENSVKTESNFFEPVKSYCQPTISSKRKQVDRDVYSNLTNINVRNIPFVAAKSTAPSHNIGINIQQVLSIIKKRYPLSENSNPDTGNQENPLIALLASKKIGTKTNQVDVNLEVGTVPGSSESKKRSDVVRTSLSHWKSNSDFPKEKSLNALERVEEKEAHDWSLKVDKLKRVLVFLHEDFTSLSQKYKRLQKKLTKRNITKTDAKDELADIERDLEKKEEEITVVIGLYKEVLSLREDLKKSQEKYNLVACGRTFMFEGLRQSSSTHTQMTTLLRKIQNFQDQLKG